MKVLPSSGTLYVGGKKISSESTDNSFHIDISPNGVISGWPWDDRSIKSDVDSDSDRLLMVLDLGSIPDTLQDIQFYTPDDTLIEMVYSNDNTLGINNQLWIEKNNELFYFYFKTQYDIARYQFTIPNTTKISIPSKSYQEIESFPSSYEKEKCEGESWEGGYGGIYEPEGGLDLNPLIEFDVLGEVNSVYSQNHLILTGLSNSNGLLLTKINSDGTIIFQKSIAKGYTVNDVYSSDRFIGLAVGHDGVLIYSIEGNDSFVLEGRLATNYANSIKIKDKNIYVGTEDGIEIFILD